MENLRQNHILVLKPEPPLRVVRVKDLLALLEALNLELRAHLLEQRTAEHLRQGQLQQELSLLLLKDLMNLELSLLLLKGRLNLEPKVLRHSVRPQLEHSRLLRELNLRAQQQEAHLPVLLKLDNRSQLLVLLHR